MMLKSQPTCDRCVTDLKQRKEEELRARAAKQRAERQKASGGRRSANNTGETRSQPRKQVPVTTGDGLVCAGCLEEIRGGRYVKLSDNTKFHKNCFLCKGCGGDLTSGYRMVNGVPKCGPCSSSRRKV